MDFELNRYPHEHDIYNRWEVSSNTNIIKSLGSRSQAGGLSPNREDIDNTHEYSIESFHVHEKGSIVKTNAEKKLGWLRSQIIGHDVVFDTPFGKRRLTYADHTASGRSLHYIENYTTTILLPFYGNSHTSDNHVGYRTTKMSHEAAKYVRKCLGGGENDAILFCGSGSTAAIKRLQEVMGIAVPSILRDRVLANCLHDQERWVVFVGPYEHHSNILPWRQSLAEVVEIGLDHHGLLDMKTLREKLECYQATGRPILGSFSACSNVTGICTDTRAIACLFHHYGGFACFDFAASGPYEKIEMRSGEIDGYDAIFLSTHKFLGGPGTPGILLMSKKLYRLGSSPPSTCGGGTVNFVNGYNDKDTLYVADIEEREDAGTPPIVQKIRAALAFWIKEYIGYKTIEKQEQKHILRALERLHSNPQVSILGNVAVKRQAILSFLIHSTKNENDKGLEMWKETGNTTDKPLHGPFVAKLLNDLFGIQARGGCACAGPYGHSLLNVDQTRSLAFKSVIQKGYTGIKPGWTRVSFPYYMSEEEFEFILSAIEFISVYGQRFLSLYHFNWRTGEWTFKENASKHIIIGKNEYSNSISGRQSLSNMIKALNMSGCDDNGLSAKEEDVICTYRNYFECAKRVGSLLPKFPPQRRISQEINTDLVPFRV